MTKRNIKGSVRTKRKIKNQPKKSEYFDFGKLSTSLGDMVSSVLSSLYQPLTCTNSEKNKGRRKPSNNNSSHNFRENKRRKHTENQNILTIDLNKIEVDLKLRPKEKKELKRMLEKIRLDNRTSKSRKCLSIITNNCSSTNDNSNSSNNLKGNISREESHNFTRKNKHSDGHADIQERGFETVDQERARLKPCLKQLPTKLCVSKCYNMYSEHCSNETRSILKAKTGINVTNLRLKCVRPICVVQYSTNSNEDYSRATLKAHLGEGQCPLINDPHSEHPLQHPSYDDEDSEDYVIAKGTLTNELVESFKALKEIRRSLFPESESGSTITEDGGHRRKSSRRKSKHSTIRESIRETLMESTVGGPVSVKPSDLSLVLPSPEEDRQNKTHWDVESFPSTLCKLEKNFLTERDEKLPQKERSMFSKMKEACLKTCFCMCFEDDSKTLDTNEAVHNNRFKFFKGNKLSSSRFKNKGKFTRTTESKFLKKGSKTNQP